MRTFLPLCFMLLLSGVAFTQNDKINVKVDPFDRLELNGAFRVFLHQGDREEVSLEGPASILDRMEVEQRGDKIRVQSRNEERTSLKKIDVYVYFRDLSRLEINGVGQFVAQTSIHTRSLDLVINGIKELDIEIYVEDLTAEISGLGRNYIAGSADVADININGIGSLDALDLEVRDLRIETNGIGKAEVFATEEISVSAYGIGSVYYRGNPAIKYMDKSGIGKVKAL